MRIKREDTLESNSGQRNFNIFTKYTANIILVLCSSAMKRYILGSIVGSGAALTMYVKIRLIDKKNLKHLESCSCYQCTSAVVLLTHLGLSTRRKLQSHPLNLSKCSAALNRIRCNKKDDQRKTCLQ